MLSFLILNCAVKMMKMTNFMTPTKKKAKSRILFRVVNRQSSTLQLHTIKGLYKVMVAGTSCCTASKTPVTTWPDLKKRQENTSVRRVHIIYSKEKKMFFWVGFCYLIQASLKFTGSGEFSLQAVSASTHYHGWFKISNYRNGDKNK